MPRKPDRASERLKLWINFSRDPSMWKALRTVDRKDAIGRAAAAFGLDAEEPSDRAILFGALAMVLFPDPPGALTGTPDDDRRMKASIKTFSRKLEIGLEVLAEEHALGPRKRWLAQENVMERRNVKKRYIKQATALAERVKLKSAQD
jgi:hypothetical protein